MRIQYQETQRQCSIVGLFMIELESRGEEGIMEDTRDTAISTAEALGRLVDELAQRGILDVASVHQIATGYPLREKAQLL